MAFDVRQTEADLKEAVEAGYRGNLLAKGQARNLIWADGETGDDAPPFSTTLSYDLLTYGYALLGQGLRLLDMEGDPKIGRTAFESAAEAIEAVVVRGKPTSSIDFHRLLAGAAFHLGHYSARAYSLLKGAVADGNLTVCERVLGHLILRNIPEIERTAWLWRSEGQGDDAALVERLSNADKAADDADASDDDPVIDVLDLALTDNFMGAIGLALEAFSRGQRALLDVALARLRTGLEAASEAALVPQFWVHRVTVRLLDDLWSSSLHVLLPLTPPEDVVAPDWPDLRRLFIASLLRRKGQIDLWPSQRKAAALATQVGRNLVVSLPTSAGKTRIAELCILACLATQKRVFFITPLRALSAQTEAALRDTFEPLGKTVSGLYGSVGSGDVDGDLLRDRDIVVATPEKLDFAIRNDPGILDDVGLIVLDEGHMIGTAEREVRYEVQIQRLLRRSDAAQRRIVCLSAILPPGKKLDDFVGWLSRDQDGGLIKKDWRPTKLRFGEVEWRADHARLTITVGDEKPWVPRLLVASKPPIGTRRKLFPSSQRELCLATAWRMLDDGHSVLIFCPIRRSVEPFAREIVALHNMGVLRSVLPDGVDLTKALSIGAEWLGDGHPILECLKLGVAVHHGRLPTPLRREIESLLQVGVLKVTISSPTLAQGLNLSATTLIFHGLSREGEKINVSEFKNVVGRAGRAYVDGQGLVLYPMFDGVAERREHWEDLVKKKIDREMESGIVRLVVSLLVRLRDQFRLQDPDALLEYVVNTPDWAFQALPRENPRITQIERTRFDSFLTSLDGAVLGILGEDDIPDAEVATRLDEALASSLWARSLARRNETGQRLIKSALTARANVVWARTTPVQRRGFFRAGLGLAAGLALHSRLSELAELLVRADAGIAIQEPEAAIEALVAFAEIVFTIPPFKPDKLPASWKEVLRAWLRGQPLKDLVVNDADVLELIESAFVYRLTWGLEAVRAMAAAEDWVSEAGFGLDDLAGSGFAGAAVETGSVHRSAAVLMQAGFTSRSGAWRAVVTTDATFDSLSEMRTWLRATDIRRLAEDRTWPTATSRDAWLQFTSSFTRRRRERWSVQDAILETEWMDDVPRNGAALRLRPADDGYDVLGADFVHLGRLKSSINLQASGVFQATSDDGDVALAYVGPEDLELEIN